MFNSKTMVLVLVVLLFAAIPVTADEAAVDPIPRFRQIERQVSGGLGYAGQLAGAVGRNDVGGALAWGASYLWHAYLDAFEASRETQWLDVLVKDFDAALAVRDDVRGVTDHRGRARATWGSGSYSDELYYPWAVHNGVATYPMARFVEIVLNDPALDAYVEKANHYLQEIQKTVQAFDEDWRDGPRAGQGYYIFPEDMPGRVDLRGRKLPLNQQNAMGLTLLVLADITDNQEYRRKAEALARYFYSVLKRLPDGSYVWSYWGDFEDQSLEAPELISETAAARFPGEDISHAALNAIFAHEAYRRGVVFTREDMMGIAQTVVAHIWAPTDQGRPAVRHNVTGTGQLHQDGWLVTVARGWAYLSQFDPRVYRVAERTFEALSATGTTAALGAAALDRWSMKRDEVEAILNANAASSIRPAATTYVEIHSPRHGVELKGEHRVQADVLAPLGIKTVEVLIDGEPVYSGSQWPFDVTVNRGELEDGWHLLEVRVDDGISRDSDMVGVMVANTHIVSPHYSQPVRGSASVELESGIGPEAIKEVRVFVDDTLIYSGPTLPEDVSIDSWQLADDFHQLTAEIVSIYNVISRDQVYFRVENNWVIDDALRPPQVSWFGTHDRSLTSSTSEGWRYDTSAPADFHGDQDRKVPSGEEEFLIWETPRLTEAVVTVYSRELGVEDVIELALGEGGMWHSLDFETVNQGSSSAGWHKIQLRALVEDTVDETASFRLLVRHRAGQSDTVQIGHVYLTGTHIPRP